MSTDTTIPDDILEAAKKSAEALVTRMCVTMDHSFGLQSEQEQRGLRTSMTQLAEHDIAPAIAKAIHDAVMAERARIVALLLEEAELTPCGEDAMVTRSNAFLIKADFSYEEAERLSEEAEG